MKAGAAAEKAAAEADNVAKAANEIRATVGAARAGWTCGDGEDTSAPDQAFGQTVKDQVRRSCPEDSEGEFIDPNTASSSPGNAEIGHKPGYEARASLQRHSGRAGPASSCDLLERSGRLQMEDRAANRSHQYESDVMRGVEP